MKLTIDHIQDLEQALPTMGEEQKRRTLELIKTWYTQKAQDMGRESFLAFIDHVYPGYKVGPHHRRLAKIFEEIAAGTPCLGSKRSSEGSRSGLLAKCFLGGLGHKGQKPTHWFTQILISGQGQKTVLS